MGKKLALLVVGLALTVCAFAAPGAVPIGMKSEWDAWQLKLYEKYSGQYSIANGAPNYNIPWVIDTMTIPQGRITDTFAMKQGLWYGCLFTDDEAEQVSVRGYRNTNGSALATLTPPDSSLILFPGYIGPNLILVKSASDTASATCVTIVGMPKPPIR